MMYFMDPLFLLFALPGLALSLLASLYVKTTFARYSKVASRRGLTGAEAAQLMLQRNGITDVRIESIGGSLTDHYDPRDRTLRLSSPVYASNSLAAIGVACHEAGHALQHAQHYSALALRTTLVPATNFGSQASYFFFIGGFLFRSQSLILIGALLFGLAVLFSIVTLPVEWNASARAKVAMLKAGIVSPHEQREAGRVLNAAFLTYVAAAVSAILTLLYYLLRAGVFGGSDD